MKTTRRLVSVLAAAGLVGVLGALPASAATRNFTTEGRGDAGWVTGYLSVIYTGARSFGLTAWNDDHCGSKPGGNGMGAYLYLRVVHGDGSVTGLPTMIDENGCDNGGDYWDVTIRYQKTVNRVEGRLCEEDRNGPKASICTGWKSIAR